MAKSPAEPETVAKFGIHGTVVEQRETVLELVVKSLQRLRLSRNSEFMAWWSTSVRLS